MEFVAALRSTTFDEAKPSLFELLSEAQLSALLPPTLRYLLTVATQRHPRHLLRILNSFDELYALLALLVEHHYLRTCGGTFTEHFYGLRRERVPSPPSLPRAAAAAPDPSRAALRAPLAANLAAAVLVPYLERRLADAHNLHAPRRLLGAAYNRAPPPGAPARERLLFAWRWFLARAFPAAHAAHRLAALAFGLAYLFGRSPHHSPLMWLVGTRVRRMTAADHRAVEERLAPPAGGAPRPLAARALGGLSLLLPASIFALKFLEWWHSADFAKQLSRRAAEGLELPPPVVAGMPGGGARAAAAAAAASGREGEEEKEEEEEKAPVAAQSLLPIYTVAPPADSQLCPICGEEIATATACQTGFVFCYGCIHKWVAGQHPRQESFMRDREGRWESGAGRCAVTGRRVLGGTEGLRRIIV